MFVSGFCGRGERRRRGGAIGVDDLFVEIAKVVGARARPSLAARRRRAAVACAGAAEREEREECARERDVAEP